MTEVLALVATGALGAADPLVAAAGRRLVRGLVLLVLAAVLLGLLVLAIILVTRWLRRRRVAPGGIAAAETETEPGPPLPPGAAISVQHLKKTYRMGRVEVRALDDVSLEIPEGAMVCIMGKSGSGKSTLLRQLGLIDRPTGGRVRLYGEDVTALSEGERSALRLSRLGYVFQEYALLPELTARENIYLPAMMRGKPLPECRRHAEELLDVVGLADRATHRPKELSGGEQQRVAIARALVNGPRVIYADEPTANLDSLAARTVMETLRKLNESFHVTVLFVSHDPDDAQYATRLVHLKDGRIAEAPA